MWQKFLEFSGSVLQIGNLLVENQKQLKEIQSQVNEMGSEMKLMKERFEHFSDMERANHRNNLLELENRLLQMERRLPPKQD